MIENLWILKYKVIVMLNICNLIKLKPLSKNPQRFTTRVNYKKYNCFINLHRIKHNGPLLIFEYYKDYFCRLLYIIKTIAKDFLSSSITFILFSLSAFEEMCIWKFDMGSNNL